MEISHSGIGEKVCKTTRKSSSDKYGVYADSTGTKSGNDDTSLCGDSGRTGSGGSDSPQALKEFIAGTLKDYKNWPTSTGTGSSNNDNAKAVAKDLVALNRDEKTIVAGLLAKTIEGGEVVEIRAVSSTSVMVNSSGYTKLRHMM
ncbi:P44-1 outer membrane protein [Anaplasma phagocytophilum str. MRK]|nr:P44-1 outer membrane protein [Anaplasma phagocytophilum str. MRK]